MTIGHAWLSSADSGNDHGNTNLKLLYCGPCAIDGIAGFLDDNSLFFLGVTVKEGGNLCLCTIGFFWIFPVLRVND